jgi:hypothetical protein
VEQLYHASPIALEASEKIAWELLDCGKLHLVRKNPCPPSAKRHARPENSEGFSEESTSNVSVAAGNLSSRLPR